MKLSLFIQIIALIFLISVSWASRPGGESQIYNRKEYREAIRLLEVTGLKSSRITVEEIYRQVVSGIRYRYSCKVQRRSGKTKPCVIEIVSKPWMTPKQEVLKNTCLKI
jgi:hypothetical protein